MLVRHGRSSSGTTRSKASYSSSRARPSSMRTDVAARPPGRSGSGLVVASDRGAKARRKAVSACVAGPGAGRRRPAASAVAHQRGGEHAGALHRGERQGADRQVAASASHVGVAPLREERLHEAHACGGVLLAARQGAAEQGLGLRGVAALVERGAEEEPPGQLVDAVALEPRQHVVGVGVGCGEQGRGQVEAGRQVRRVLDQRALRYATAAVMSVRDVTSARAARARNEPWPTVPANRAGASPWARQRSNSSRARTRSPVSRAQRPRS